MKTGDRISDYIIERLLGEGGMATVYLARHEILDQQVAIKVLDPEVARKAGVKKRFIQEANIQVSLKHPHIVPVLTATKTESGAPALIMEYMNGESLFQVLQRRGTLPVDDALEIMAQVLSAVGYAHDRGVIHRDLKPSNVMVVATGEAKVTDFGIAKVVGSSKLTRTGTAMGSAHYMSPEQIRRPETVDARSDIYSLGCVFYEVLTGRPPFGEKDSSGTESDYEVKNAHVTESVPELEAIKIGIPEWLAQLVMTMLEKDAEKRPPSCKLIAAAIAQKLKQQLTSKDLDSDQISLSTEDEVEEEKIDSSISNGKIEAQSEFDDQNGKKLKARLLAEEFARNQESYKKQKEAVEKAIKQEIDPKIKKVRKFIENLSLIMGVFIFFVFFYSIIVNPEEKFPSIEEATIIEETILTEIDKINTQFEAIKNETILLEENIKIGKPNRTTEICQTERVPNESCWVEKDRKKYGDIYTGEVMNGKQHGMGGYQYLDENQNKGNTYFGNYKEGKKSGLGTYTYASGEKYIGEWKNGKKNGLGQFTSPNGGKYVGEWMDDKKNGIGTDNLPNGLKYAGEFKDGSYNGRGIIFQADGSVKESGIYQNNKLIKSEYVDPNSFSRIAK